MSVQKRGKVWRVRWKEGDRFRSRTFDRKKDADSFDAELTPPPQARHPL